MSTLTQSEQTVLFQKLLEQHYKLNSEKGPLQKAKDKAWDHFRTIGLPKYRDEVYRYVPLKNLFANTYSMAQSKTLNAASVAPFILPECAQSVLVFVNGYYQSILSNVTALPKRVTVSTLNDAMGVYGTFLNNQWTKSLKLDADPFTVLNAALHKDGAFIYIPPKTVVETPIQILQLIDIQEHHSLIMPRLHLFVGAQSEASLISSIGSLSGKNHCINQASDIAIEEDAHVHLTQINYNEPEGAWHFDSWQAALKRNSSFTTVLITDGAATVRNDYRISIIGENAHANLNGLSLLKDAREAHTHVLVDHQAPNCQSNQLFKSVLNDFSRASFEGKILVQQAAQKTNAFQLNNNLLLSDRANASSKPNLEIFADDVKASHGATVGQLDPDQLFYMQTRGFSKAAAQNMLVYSFSKEVIDLIKLPSLQYNISQRAKEVSS